MIRLLSTKTFPIILFMLGSPSFSQTDIHKATGISIGRVNKIVKWLADKGIVIRHSAKYHLVRPNKLAELIGDQYALKPYMTFEVGLDRKDAIRKIKRAGVLCLDSALERHDTKHKGIDIQAYANEEVINLLNTLPRGGTRIHLYQEPFKGVDVKDGTTSAIQTILDMHATGQDTPTGRLALKIWGTMQ